MKVRKMFLAKPWFTACLFTLLLTACSAVKRGKVVDKGIDPTGTKMHPGPIHWVDIRGENRHGATVTARVELFEIDWQAIRKNDWIAPDSYGLPRFFQRIHAYNEAQRAESGRFGATAKIVQQPKPRKPRRTVARRAPATPAPEAEQLNPPPAPESTTPPTSPAPVEPKPELTAEQRAERLRVVREQALEDPALLEMKASIKSARSEAEQERAWRDYRATLRDKMHAIDPSLSDLIE